MTALVTAKQFGALIEAKKSDIIGICNARGLNFDELKQTALLAFMDNQELLESCTPASLLKSTVHAVEMGLRPGGGFGEGYMIPYKGECTFRASYRGWMKVARDCPEIDMIRASVVYENDDFDLSEMPPSVSHKPALTNRGKCIGAVAVAFTLRGDKHVLYDFAWMSAEDLETAKEIANQYKKSPAWAKWEDEMRKKSVIRRLCKMLPASGTMSKLQAIENAVDDGATHQDPDLMIVDQVFEQVEPTPPPAKTKRTEETKKGLKTGKRPGKRKKPEPAPEPEPALEVVEPEVLEEPPPLDDEAFDFGEPE